MGELCQLPVDIVLKSSDNVLIGAHKTNLEQWSEGFPKAESVVEDDDPVELPENAETLKLLMTCMHNHQFPGLSGLAPYKLFDLARAAEKYEVNAVKAACNGHIVWQWVPCSLLMIPEITERSCTKGVEISSREPLLCS